MKEADKSIEWVEDNKTYENGRTGLFITRDGRFRISEFPDNDCRIEKGVRDCFDGRASEDEIQEEIKRLEKHGAWIVFLEECDPEIDNDYSTLDCLGGVLEEDRRLSYIIEEYKDAVKKILEREAGTK